MDIKIDDKLAGRFAALKPVDGHDQPISIEKYVNDFLADAVAADEELERLDENSRQK